MLTSYFLQLGTVILWCLSQPSFPPESSQGLVQCLRQSLSQLKLSVGHLLPALLRWSQRPASMNLRIEAMGCLLDLRSYFQVHELLPYKRTVLREMPVGDRKRLVRKAASTTALAWHMLGEASKWSNLKSEVSCECSVMAARHRLKEGGNAGNNYFLINALIIAH